MHPSNECNAISIECFVAPDFHLTFDAFFQHLRMKKNWRSLRSSILISRIQTPIPRRDSREFGYLNCHSCLHSGQRSASFFSARVRIHFRIPEQAHTQHQTHTHTPAMSNSMKAVDRIEVMRGRDWFSDDVPLMLLWLSCLVCLSTARLSLRWLPCVSIPFQYGASQWSVV